MKNPLLEKVVWDWQDAAVAADWAMERGVFGADLWRYYPPEFVRCLAECPELLDIIRIPPNAGRPGAWEGAGVHIGTTSAAWARAWIRAGAKAGLWAGERAWTFVHIGRSFYAGTRLGTPVHVAGVWAMSLIGAGAGVIYPRSGIRNRIVTVID